MPDNEEYIRRIQEAFRAGSPPLPSTVSPDRHSVDARLGIPSQPDDSGFDWWEAFGKQENPVAFGAQVGSGVGGLVGGLINLFGSEPDHLLEAYRQLKRAYENLEDPEILKQVWQAPVIQKIAQFSPEILQGLGESVEDYETYGEGDAGLRAQEDRALARITDRARRGDPLQQRIMTQEAQSGVGRALGRAGLAAQAAGARRGMAGAGFGPAGMQAGADYASRVGARNVLAARGDMASAERAAFAGASGVRQQREAAKERALNVRNNFRNAMSNRQLAVNIANQKSRQSASDRNQGLAQSIHERNLYAADQRRIMNQRQRNQWAREQYGMDRQRLMDRERMDLGIAGQEDILQQRRQNAIASVAQGAFSLAGAGIGMGVGGTDGGTLLDEEQS